MVQRSGLLILLGLLWQMEGRSQISSVTRRTVQKPVDAGYFSLSNSASAGQGRTTVVVPIPSAPSAPVNKEEQEAKILAFQKKKAAEGLPTAQYDLGLRYATGTGVLRDLKLARKWLQAAAEQGHKEASKKLLKLPAS